MNMKVVKDWLDIDFGCCALISSVFIFHRERMNAYREVESVESQNCHLIEGIGMYMTVQFPGHHPPD